MKIMKLIETIKLRDLTPVEVQDFEIRKAARAVVFDSSNNIGVLYVSNEKYHKLPGGGLEGEEEIEEALRRECLEEIGCDIEIEEEIGEIIEYRDKWSLKQHSYCYIAKVKGEKGNPSFTEKEVNSGFQIKWLKLEEAIEILKNDSPEDYQGVFIQKRDSLFLEEVKKLV